MWRSAVSSSRSGDVDDPFVSPDLRGLPLGASGAMLDDLVVDLERREGSSMVVFARRLGLSPEQAEDTVQDVFLRLWEQMVGGTVIRSPSAWCYRALYRRAMDEHRLVNRIARAAKVLIARADQLDDGSDAMDGSIWQEVDRLPRRQREVLYLRYKADLPFDAIAAALGITAGGARANAAKALTSLRSTASKEDVS